MQRFVCTTSRGAYYLFSSLIGASLISSGPVIATAFSLSVGLSAGQAMGQSTPAPEPSASSGAGDTVTNPVTGLETTVTDVLVDPAGTPTAGDVAFVQTADGYTFLVKAVGETFYNSDNPPVAFTITSISGGTAEVTSAQASGSADFPIRQTTADFNSNFNSSGNPGQLEPPVDVVGPNGVRQVVYGRDGDDGRAGALFVPPSSGGDGHDGPTQSKTLTTDVNATSNIGWEIGSVGGDGGKGGNSYASFWSGRDGGDGGKGGTVTAVQAATSTIQTSGSDHYGIFAYSRSGKAGNGGSGFAAPGGGTGGHSADGGSVTVEQFGAISTTGQNSHGIYGLSVSNNGGNGGDQWGIVGQSGSAGFGGNGGSVDITTHAGASILTSGNFANGILAQSVGGTGGSAGFSGNLLVSLIGSADNGGNGSDVTVSNGGQIQTSGALSRGIMAQSVGGGGGAGGAAGGLVSLALGGVGSKGGSGGKVSVSNAGTGEIVTTGLLSDGILAQSIGGSGGQGADAAGLVAVGGTGTKGGSGDTVNVSNLGRIETTGEGARGIVAQSIGGGGGDGGSSAGMVAVGGTGSGGGSGAAVTVLNDGVIATRGDDAMGILAQSIGGGGGNGGSAGAVGLFVGVAVGGGGSTGGAGGQADVTLSNTDTSQPSQIRTEGDRATGVFVQSVGGGGGNGGGAVSVAVGAFGAAAISVGGRGGAGGDGGRATLNGSGSASVQTGGADAAGVLMQSVGGGGGNGGYSVAAAASGGPVSGSISVGVGGSGNAGGTGGEVRVGTVDGSGNLTAPGFSGSVVTTGERSAGMLFQSIGGGGGNGGLAVAASGGGSLIFSGSLSVGVGGSASGGGAGGRVRVYTASDINTVGNGSVALMAQSVGGGGGNGGGSIAGGVNASGGGAAGINIAVAGSGAAASAGGQVDLIAGGSLIRTRGQFSTGLVAQSIGGGGGNGGYAIAAGASAAGGVAANVDLSLGGKAGGGGSGGAVSARVDADVETRGDDSGAVLVQSVGGGGGNGGYSVAAGVSGAGGGAGNVTVALGGSGGSGGAGSTVSATINGDVSTQGDRASGVVAQSIGGGGGNGGFSVSGAISGAGVGSGSVAVGLGGGAGSGGMGGAVSTTVAGDVTTVGDDSSGVVAQSVGGGGGNGGFSVAGTITGSGTGSGAVSVGLGGGGGVGADAGTVTLVSNGYVLTQGERSSGVVAQSIGGGGGNGGFSVAGTIAGAGVGAGSVSVGLGGDGAGGGNAGGVNATSNGEILTYGFASSGLVAQSIGGGGGNGGFTVSAALSFGGTGAGSVGVGLGGSGDGGGNGGAVLAASTARVETRGDASIGVLAQSVGGGGGNGGFSITPTLSGAGVGSGAISVGLGGSGAGGGNGGSVGLTMANDVLTLGAHSSAVVAQSLGGGGGNGGFSVSAAGTGAGTGSGAIGVGMGGRGAGGGTGGAVTSAITGDLTTEGDGSSGLIVQSLGGGGGNGGMNVSAALAVAGTGAAGASVGMGGAAGAGGDGGTVTSALTGDVLTFGRDSGAVIVQSMGGGGGNGGLNISAAMTGAGTGSGGVSVGLGGSGGSGGDGAAVDSEIAGDVTTLGDNSAGVVVQSAGGGGGNGGVSVTAAVNLSGTGGGALAVGLGGSGGGGGQGGTATGRMSGDIVTLGENATGMTVQSLGGGGGNGGVNVAAAISAASNGSGAAAIGLGGSGGNGGDASSALGVLTGDVATAGVRSGGMLVQSLGGGGGNGGLNVSGAISMSSQSSGAVSLGIGGAGGLGGAGAAATGTVTGDVTTQGADATAVMVQSVGGGGGNGGLNVSGALSIGGNGSGAAAIGVGGFGGGGGTSDDVTGTYAGRALTSGDRSAGVVAQSLGGGGGNGGINVSAGISVGSSFSGALGLGVGGFGGSGGAAGSVDHHVSGTIQTAGEDATGVLSQSLGGGGGNGGLNVSGAVSLSRQTSAAVGLGVGGFGGGGADAGTFTAARFTGSVLTFGDRSAAVATQSLGGGGGNGGMNVTGSINLTQNNGGAGALGLGGFGGGGGDGKAVTSTVATAKSTESLQTRGADSIGVLAQSVGGGGGSGGLNVSGAVSLTGKSGAAVALGVGGFGGAGGDGGPVSLDVTGSVITMGDRAHGLLAQSLGGGGGSGGTNVSGSLALTKPSGSDTIFSISAGVGGFGGGGGNADAVALSYSGTLTAVPRSVNADGSTTPNLTYGASGIVAQSIGGGGGDGGVNVTAGVAISSKPGAGQTDGSKSYGVLVGVGGFGGVGGDAGAVDVDLTAGSVVTAHGTGRSGILAQSVGGGGGNGGLNVSGGLALSKDGKIPSVTFGIGGFGGAANLAGDVVADHAGRIGVEGNWKHGILAQSVAGGGGNGGLNVSGQLNWGSSQGSGGATDLSVVAGLGGHGGTGADAGQVEVISSGDIATQGYHARGVFAQSVGGGGGTGGMNITAVGTKDSSPVAIGVGGFGAGGGDAGAVSVARGTATVAAGRIDTDGIGAHGIEASSIGGGGGDAGINAVLGFSKTTGSASNGGTAGDRKTPTNTGVDPSVLANYNAVLDELEGKTASTTPSGGKQVNSAIIAIGGSAGNAGKGGQVDVVHYGNVETRQNASHGVFAQALGGGGGNAAFNFGMVYEAGNAKQNRGFGLAIGGGTGNGGSGGDVSVANTGDVSTAGDDAHGIFAQSVGGGGGNAGYTSLTTGGDGGNIAIQIGRTGGTGGTAGNVSAASSGEVLTRGARSHGLFAQSIGNGGGNSSASSFSLSTAKTADTKGTSFKLSLGLEGGLGGASGNVTANASGLLYTLGDESHGIFAQSVGGGGGTGGGAGGAAGAGTSYSLNIGGTGGTGGVSGLVDVRSAARIATEGARANGILAQSVGGAGGTGGYVKSGTSVLSILKNTVKGSEVGTTASINVGGTGGAGMTSGDVSVDSDGVISTLGDSAHGVFAQSVGGGGGMGLVDNTIVNLRLTIATTATLSIGGDGGTGAVSGDVSVTNRSSILTAGGKSAGILAMAVGGGGGDAHYVRNIIAGPDADNSSRNALLIGGSGGSGASAGAVTVENASGAQIQTIGEQSHGIFAQSVGGGGGNGGDVLSISVSRPGSTAKVRQGLQLGLGGAGGAGGTAGKVEVRNSGVIMTEGAGAHGVLAQSVGGGGGNGGYSITGTTTLQTGSAADPSVALNIGGAGGSGNAAGAVTVANEGQIDVSGTGAFGVLAQSVGGGGGNGGVAVALSLNDLAKQAKGQSYSKLAVGGAGGAGADGGDVTVTHDGTITLRGDNAYGIFAQSVGGAGGNAGLSISTPAAMAADYVISTLLGARSGTEGTAGEVVVDSTGDIVVTGANSQTILSQSVNGGGGNVRTFLDFTATDSAAARSLAAGSVSGPDVGVASSLALGGEDVSGSQGADVSQTHRGDMLTTAARATGMMLQSVGGGGGSALTDLKLARTGDLDLSAVLGAVRTDDAGGGDIAGRRIGAVETRGDMSVGGLTQSIGGGGGRLILNADSGAEGPGLRQARVALGAEPSLRNDGGDVSLTLNGAVVTSGDHADGQVVQSIGAGGGQAMLSGLDRATITLGGRDGSTGDGGVIALASRGNVQTSGWTANGFVLQSIGGGGGSVVTDLAASALTVDLSADNAGDGGAIRFENRGHVLTSGRDAVGVLAQSLGGGGGTVDATYRGSAGGAGRGGSIELDLSGNILSLGPDGIAVMAQSAGGEGGQAIQVALDGVIVGGAADTALSARAPVRPAGSTAGPAAIVVDGGSVNTVSLSSDSFLMSLNDLIVAGGVGDDRVTLRGEAVGNVDLDGGVNRLTVAKDASFTALDRVDLGTTGTMRVNGDLYLGGDPYLADGASLSMETTASQFRLTQNVSQTTDVTGELAFGRSASYSPDVYFAADGASGGNSDLIRVTGDATLSGTVRPVLQLLERTRPLALIEAEGQGFDDKTQVVDTAVIDYSISVTRSGGISSINLLADADFAVAGVNRNQRLLGEHIGRVLTGQGSVTMGPMFALIANMQSRAEVIDALDRLSPEGYAATQVAAMESGRRFAGTMGNCDNANMAVRADDPRACYWVAAEASNLVRAATTESKRLALDSSTFSTGMRMPVGDDVYLGLAAGFQQFGLSNGDRFAADGKRAHLGVSLSTYRGPFELYGQLSGSRGRAHATRQIGITGQLPNGDQVTAGTVRASQGISQANLRIGGGYRYQLPGSDAYLRPGLDLDATWLRSSSVSEEGDRYGMALKRTSQWVLSATPSLEVGADIATDGRTRMRAYLRGEMTFSNARDIHVNATFPGASAADGTFRTYSEISDRTRRLKAGMTFYSKDGNGYMNVGYQGEWGRDTVGHSASLAFGMRF